MGAFEYTAVDTGGKEQRGVIEGDTPRAVRQLLRDRQLLPLQVSEVAQKESRRQSQTSLGLRRGISAMDLALLTRQLATLVHSGLPLEEALLAVSEHSEKPRLKSILLGVRAKVMEGHTLADGLADFPHAFPEMYRTTVSAGEQSGHLDSVLERLADYTEGRQLLRQKITQAMLYPIILTVLAFAIVGLMMVYVVPKIVGIFENSGQELPWLTTTLISISDYLRDFGLVTIIVLGVVAWLVRRWLKRDGPRRKFHRLLLRLPLVAQLVRGLNTARFTRTLSILAGSGVPVLEALRIAAQVVSNIPMREAVDHASLRVREGGEIGKSLGASRLFPPMTIHLVSSGEASGELEAMLGRAATNQEREMDGLIAALLGILEPLMIVLMGAVVLIIVLAMLLPIFELNQTIQ